MVKINVSFGGRNASPSIDIALTHEKPKVDFIKGNKIYAIIMVDTREETFFLEVNVSARNPNGESPLAYRKPQKPGTYWVQLYQQPSEIDFNGLTYQNAFKAIDSKFEFVGFVEFKITEKMTYEQKAFCRCIDEVAAKGSAVNPYAVCAHSTGTSYRLCSENYDNAEAMSDEEIIGYAKLHKISTSGGIAEVRKHVSKYLSKK